MALASKSITAERARRQMDGGVVFSCQVYPESATGFYVEVLIFRTKAKFGKWFHSGKVKRETPWATCRAIKDGKHIATVATYLRNVTDANIVHEMFHATCLLAYTHGRIRRHAFNWRSATHERLAEAHCLMVSDFWWKFTADGFGREQCWGFGRKG